MDEALALRLIVRPTLAYLSGLGSLAVPGGPAAEALLLAIGWQESRFSARDQIDPGRVNGPALGFWQFEMAGGTAEVLEGRLTANTAKRLLDDLRLPSDAPVSRRAVWEMLEYNDTLACAFARLLLWPDPEPLPPAEDAEGARHQAWRYYLRRWRPGKPNPGTWVEAWRRAVTAVRATG